MGTTQGLLLRATAVFITVLLWLGLAAIGQKTLGFTVAIAALVVMAWGIHKIENEN